MNTLMNEDIEAKVTYTAISMFHNMVLVIPVDSLILQEMHDNDITPYGRLK